MSNGTISDLIEHLAARGVRRMFGVPGGDCNLDIIASAGRFDIDFVLTRTETAAAIMAAVTAELTGVPGVVMTTRGPGPGECRQRHRLCEAGQGPARGHRRPVRG
ncbi:MAG: thiamine pyrophosphate-binding protein, partial [Alphaproteobacteria bacterium]|nr:thiamine pyrophosphate-binding protein [Alphaproteobacteria bacterium]